jgi:hypothetical protein
MDATTATLIASGLKAALDSAAGEAGRSAWAKFSDSLGRAFGRESRIAQSASEVTQLVQNDQDVEDSIRSFTDELSSRADSERIVAMLQSHFPSLQQLAISESSGSTLGGVSNSISDNAQIGSAIQAGHVTGGIRIERAAEAE